MGLLSIVLYKMELLKVYANDVGTNQLAYSLRVNEKVVSIEQTHIKDLILMKK